MAQTELTDLVADAQKQWLASFEAAQALSTRSLDVAAGFVPKLPSPTSLIEASFTLASQVLALQKGYAMAFAEAVAPRAKAPKTAT